MNYTSKISFHFLVEKFFFRNRTFLKEFILKLIKKNKLTIDHINFIFCSDEYLLQINKDSLGHDYYTDIITFEFNEKAHPLLSDIYISIDRVRDNANANDVYFQTELHRVIFHGLLHLMGYKDKTKDQKYIMRQQEEEFLKRYFVSRETNRNT